MVADDVEEQSNKVGVGRAGENGTGAPVGTGAPIRPSGFESALSSGLPWISATAWTSYDISSEKASVAKPRSKGP